MLLRVPWKCTQNVGSGPIPGGGGAGRRVQGRSHIYKGKKYKAIFLYYVFNCYWIYFCFLWFLCKYAPVLGGTPCLHDHRILCYLPPPPNPPPPCCVGGACGLREFDRSMCLFGYAWVSLCMHINCVYICMYMYVCLCMFKFVYVCLCILLYFYVDVCMLMCVLSLFMLVYVY